jgi:hypothetical protein
MECHKLINLSIYNNNNNNNNNKIIKITTINKNKISNK